MKKKLIFICLFLIIPIKAFALIEVDITRGNLNPLPLAVSPLSLMKILKKALKKFLIKRILDLRFQLLLKII